MFPLYIHTRKTHEKINTPTNFQKMEIKKFLKKNKKISKNLLTNKKRCGTMVSSSREQAKKQRKKFFEKIFKNPLTKQKRCDTIKAHQTKTKKREVKKMTYTEAKNRGFYAVIRNSYTGEGLIVKTEEKAREYLQAPRYDKDGQPQEWFIDTLLKDYTPKTATVKTTATTTTETPTNKTWEEQRAEALAYVLKTHNHDAIMTNLTATF